METGPEVTSIKGNMLANGFPAGDGEITVSSTLKWDKQPLTLNFKQVSWRKFEFLQYKRVDFKTKGFFLGIAYHLLRR